MPILFFNRELSRLDYNRRVLAKAAAQMDAIRGRAKTILDDIYLLPRPECPYPRLLGDRPLPCRAATG